MGAQPGAQTGAQPGAQPGALAEVRAAWDAEAATYDDEPDHGLGDPAVRAAWRRLLLAALPEPPSRVVELGCGTASLSVLLAQEGFDVSGVDLSGDMLQRARAKAEAAGVRVPLTRGDAGKPPLPPSSVDVVLCRHVLWALTDPGSALDRWVSLLRPGGRLVLVEGHWHTGSGLTAAATESLLRGRRSHVQVTALPDPELWGGPVPDERYLVVSAR